MAVLPKAECSRAVAGVACIFSHGRMACDMVGCCEHCGLHAADLVMEMAPRYGALLAGVKAMQTRLREGAKA